MVSSATIPRRTSTLAVTSRRLRPRLPRLPWPSTGPTQCRPRQGGSDERARVGGVLTDTSEAHDQHDCRRLSRLQRYGSTQRSGSSTTRWPSYLAKAPRCDAGRMFTATFLGLHSRTLGGVTARLHRAAVHIAPGGLPLAIYRDPCLGFAATWLGRKALAPARSLVCLPRASSWPDSAPSPVRPQRPGS